MPVEKVQLGRFVLDLDRQELTCAGKTVHLERIPMDLLLLLVRESGKLIGREEIIERLWGKDLFFDTDNGINTAIRKIRRALGEDSDKPQFIETVPGKGYRFKGGTEAITRIAAHAVAPFRPRVMLAVLPFENLSGDPDQEYFSDGLTEETISHFGKLSPKDMGVIARTSSMTYKHTEKSVAQIGVELGVDYVVEGSVRREGGRVRVTAQLIRVKDQIHLWADNFDRPVQSILDIHCEVGTAIADQVSLKLTPEEKHQLHSLSSIDQRAHDYYMRGRFHFAKSAPPDMQKSLEYFRMATEIDPRFALPFSGIADSLMVLPINSDVPSKDAFPEAKTAVGRALALDPKSAEAHSSDAATKFWFDWDFAAADAAARRSIALNPNYSLGHLYLAHTLSNIGQHPEALSVIQQALMLDPFSLITNSMHGQFLYQANQLEASATQFRQTLEMEPRFWVAHICQAKTMERQGDFSEALEACEKAGEFSRGNTEALSIAGYVYAAMGDREKAEARIQEMLRLKKQRYVPPYNLALVYAGLGKTEDALHWLEQALTERDVHMVFLLDHKWDSLRSNPHFQRIASVAGFA